MEELRCPNKLHGLILDEDVLEVKCDSRFCGARKGVVVLHRFNVSTGKLIQTLRYADPASKEGSFNGPARTSTAVRSA